MYPPCNPNRSVHLSDTGEPVPIPNPLEQTNQWQWPEAAVRVIRQSRRTGWWRVFGQHSQDEDEAHRGFGTASSALRHAGKFTRLSGSPLSGLVPRASGVCDPLLGTFCMSSQIQTVQRFGVELSCPANWTVAFDKQPHEASISITNDETSFWLVTMYYECPDPEEVLAAAEQAFEEEYEDVDIYEAAETVGNQPTLARDVEFFCEQLTNTAKLRVFSTTDATAFLLYQGTDIELAETLPVLQAITTSLRLLGDEERIIE